MTSIPHANHEEPFFITEEIEAKMKAAGYVFEPPAHVSTTNARELFGLREGETVAEAIARASTRSTA
ncbi:transcriptional regulator [Alcaligenes ammonioxydans]|uniref:transcriptional regulator n=1 Tax=Alcaligenes ammonioxydans TaxID=2582914 RepID=UPI001F0578FE|nr:transcriptional regulator [Alcaligenes ammonioxydans]MCH1879086.1 transcriptional regulator [Alcaligenes ammonioxydans]